MEDRPFLEEALKVFDVAVYGDEDGAYVSIPSALRKAVQVLPRPNEKRESDGKSPADQAEGPPGSIRVVDILALADAYDELARRGYQL